MSSERKTPSIAEPSRLQAAIKSLFEKCQSKCTVVDMESPEDGVITPEFRSKFNKSASGIFRVDNKFKMLIKDPSNGNSTIFSVGELDPGIENIKLTLMDDCKLSLGDSGIKCFGIISFKLKSGQKCHFFITSDAGKAEITRELSVIQRETPTQYIEEIEKKQFRNKSMLVAEGYWDKDWEQKAIGYYGTVADRYTINDKIILKDFETYLQLRAIENQELTILDVGGGKGRLARKIIELAQQYNVKLNYVLVEPSKTQCKVAREALRNLKNAEVTVIDKTLQEFKESPDFDKYRGNAQCLISSGGPLNQQIVEAKTAFSHLAICTELLGPDGILIATGLSPLLVTKKDLNKKFDVVCTAERESNGVEFLQNYVCVRKTDAAERKAGKAMPTSPTIWSEAFAKLEWEVEEKFDFRGFTFNIRQTHEDIHLHITAPRGRGLWCPKLDIKQKQKITEFKSPEDKVKYIIAQCVQEGKRIKNLSNAAIIDLFNSLAEKQVVPPAPKRQEDFFGEGITGWEDESSPLHTSAHKKLGRKGWSS